MTSLRRPLLLSIATLLAGITLFQADPSIGHELDEDQAVAGIEREGDIPLPVALG